MNFICKRKDSEILDLEAILTKTTFFNEEK